MEHSWEVGVIAHLLGVINRGIYSGELSPDRLATLAMYHDCAEAITGDLPTPVKYYSKDIQQAYRVIEQDAAQALLAMLPAKLQEPMSEYMQDSLVNWQERKYVKAADSLSAYLKVRAELVNGNLEYRHTLEDIERRLVAYQLPEVGCFLEHFSGENISSQQSSPVLASDGVKEDDFFAGQSVKRLYA
jgi:5'-deoxynucleotidase